MNERQIVIKENLSMNAFSYWFKWIEMRASMAQMSVSIAQMRAFIAQMRASGKSIITNCRNLYIFISFLKGEILEDALLFSNLVPGIDLVGGLLSFPALGVDSSAPQLGPVFLCSWYGGGLR